MNELARIDDRLIPASNAEIAEQLEILWEALPLPTGAKPEMRLTVYIMALQGWPLWAVKEAFKKFIRGEVKGASQKFCPRPPELGGAIYEIMLPYHEEAERKRAAAIAEAKLREQLANRHSEFPPEHRVRMGFKMKVLSRGLALRQVERVAEANKRGIEDMIALGQEWGVPVPESLWGEPR